MVQGFPTARVAAVDCTFESYRSLGVTVMASAEENAVASLSLRGCTVTSNCWGAFLGCDLSVDDERVILAVNTFKNNFDKDITRHYEDKKQTLQPWRRGWAVAALNATAV
jgi:hypothetical protein